MNIRIVSYSKTGAEKANRIATLLQAQNHHCRCFALPVYCSNHCEPLTQSAVQWAQTSFQEADAIIYCCAVGIAVRAIAPWVKSKTQDPAVVVTDERGHFVISLLSGHLGGANELAQTIAEQIEAIPVITTATDINDTFAVDLFAKSNHLKIENMSLAKEISAAILNHIEVGFVSDLPYIGTLPKGLTKESKPLGICITEDLKKTPFAKTLRLVPIRCAVGIGCKKGIEKQQAERFILSMLRENNIAISDIRCVASIDLKKEEPALVAFCQKYRLPFVTYTSEQLTSVKGTFSCSAFVKEITGVDCVCERAAVKASSGTLIKHKTAHNGMTFALAKYEEDIRFE